MINPTSNEINSNIKNSLISIGSDCRGNKIITINDEDYCEHIEKQYDTNGNEIFIETGLPYYLDIYGIISYSEFLENALSLGVELENLVNNAIESKNKIGNKKSIGLSKNRLLNRYKIFTSFICMKLNIIESQPEVISVEWQEPNLIIIAFDGTRQIDIDISNITFNQLQDFYVDYLKYTEVGTKIHSIIGSGLSDSLPLPEKGYEAGLIDNFTPIKDLELPSTPNEFNILVDKALRKK